MIDEAGVSYGRGDLLGKRNVHRYFINVPLFKKELYDKYKWKVED